MAKFIINPTSASRREIALAGTALSIGRDPANDLVLPDTMVSRRHAIVELRGNQIFLRDCNSSNGSLVNGDRVAERELKDGDLLAIGATRLLFRDRPPSEPLEGGAKVLPHPSAARLECPACRAEHGVGDQFCRQCGAQLAAQVAPKLLCPSCGSAQPRPAKFCTVCGATLPQGTEGLAVTRPQPALARAAELAPVAAPPGAGRTGRAVPGVRAGPARACG
jgi:pSer/pThr/pTyr-binding forkhead associated (FHA) protein